MIKVVSLFSGIGAFEKALQNLEIPFELIAYCEIDKYASKAYSVLHNTPESMNLGDITKVDEKTLPKDIDLITYGFPCQPFSSAGRQEGFNDTKGRGNLFFDALRIIQHCKPKIAIAENVKNLTSDKFTTEFGMVLKSLDDAGYISRWALLDGRDYSIPQHRERVLIVSIRKDIDNDIFEFPAPVELTKCMNDYLEEQVDEKYYVNTEKAKALIPKLREKLISNTIRGGGSGVDRHPTPVGFGGRFRQGVIVSQQCTKIEKLADCACTIMARDFKGFGNQGMNAVVEYEIK